MSHLPFTLLAYFFNSIAVTIDKFLLTKHIPNPLVYIFYISVVSMAALLLLPFTHPPSLFVFLLASLSTALWTTGAYFLYKALQKGVVSRVIPVIGTIVPIILLLQAFFTHSLSINEIWAAAILVLGLIFITLEGWKGKISAEELLFELLSSILFAFSYLILRQAYLQENFLTVLVYSRFIFFPVGTLLLILPHTRKIVLAKTGPKLNFFSKAGLLFAIGQITGGSQELLLTFSISLANPAVVNSLQGTQYVFLLVFSLLLAKKYPEIFKENLSKMYLLSKILGILLIAGGLYILAFEQSPSQKIPLGVTFSPRFAVELNLDPHKTFTTMLADLNLKKLRFPVYWDEVEKQRDQYNFSAEDFYLAEAQIRGVQVILVVGLKQPRWPECFVPNWARSLTANERGKRVLSLILKEVNHFKKYPNIVSWQVENEPFLAFGKCDLFLNGEKLLPQEIEMVRSLDSRPILITDSGELSSWRKSLPLADWFGTTLYRTVWSPLFGQVDYPLPPIFYKIKANLMALLTSSHPQKLIISELQAEPWATGRSHIREVPLNEQIKLFPAQKIADNVLYAGQTGFSQIYLWGLEWWYWMASQNHPEYINQAKLIFK